MGAGYFLDPLNYMELIHHGLFFFFVSLKLGVMDKTLMPPAAGVSSTILVVNSLVSFTALTKIFTFFRAFSTLAKMVMLISKVIYDLGPFLAIYMMVVIQQVISYT